jgi:hypothetical protein
LREATRQRAREQQQLGEEEPQRAEVAEQRLADLTEEEVVEERKSAAASIVG